MLPETDVIEDKAAETEISPEERDNQTIARILGRDFEPEEEEEDEVEESEQEGTEEEEEVEDDDSEREQAEEEDIEEDEEDLLNAIDDDDIDTFIEAVGLEKLLEREAVQKTLKETIEKTVREQAERAAAQQSLKQQEEALIQNGGKALQAIITELSRASEAVKKAQVGEEVEYVPNPQEVEQHLRALVSSTGALVRREWDNAFSNSFLAGMETLGIKSLSEDEVKAVQDIANRANQLDQLGVDRGGGGEAAKTHLFGETVKFLVNKARAQGKTEAIKEIEARRSALKKVVGDNNIKAAIVKVQKQRAKTPPRPAPAASGPSGGVSRAAYRAAKQSGNVAEIDRITAEMAQMRAQGLPIPED